MQFDRISRARTLAPRALTIAVAAALATLLAGCAVGPDYKRPAAEIPASYKEAAPGWKVAQPADQQDRGDWWTIYEDPQLNTLEDKLNASNQTIAQFAAAYRQARALVGEARAAYFPTVGASIGATRSGNGSSSNGISTTASSRSGINNSFNVQLDASWEPDLWGSVTRSVNAQKAGQQGAAADLANARLSAQATLAQTYFSLRLSALAATHAKPVRSRRRGPLRRDSGANAVAIGTSGRDRQWRAARAGRTRDRRTRRRTGLDLLDSANAPHRHTARRARADAVGAARAASGYCFG
jgi:hypothetical protein